jgi:predicted phage gp36 major capsid-like protein
VLSTRKAAGDTRRRECGNQHRFTTREVADFEASPGDLLALKRKRAALRLGSLPKGTLTVPRERQDAVMAALARGATHAQIAKELSISTKTIQKIKDFRRDCM